MATEQIRIKTITVKDRSKANVPFKNGQVMVSIKDDKERWMSQFFQAGHPVTQKRPGDTLTVDLERKGDFLNFHLIEPQNASYGQQGAPASYGPQQHQPGWQPASFQQPELRAEGKQAWDAQTAAMEPQLSRLERKMDDLHRKMDVLMGKAQDIEAQYDAPSVDTSAIPF